MPEMDAVKDAALKYDKPTLARLAQSGQLSPTIAVMAGMMRDRIVQSEMKPPAPPTVAQEVMQPMGQRMGLAAAAQPQQPQPQGQGLNQVPVPENMFERQGMAGGGIVAFQAGGATPSFAGMYQNLGPDLQALAAARQAYMGDVPTESADERASRRREEQALRLMEAGLGIAGGTSPYFAANLKGALPGIQGYAADLAAQRKEDLARTAAERAEKGKVFEGVLGMRGKAAERASAEKIAEMQASKATNMKQFSNDAVAAEEARRGRQLTDAEESSVRASANREYVTLSSALEARGLSASAAATRATTGAVEAAAAPTRTAIQEVNDAIAKRGTPQYERYREAKKKDKEAAKRGETTNFAELEYQRLIEETRAMIPGATRSIAAPAAPVTGKAPPLPPGFVAQ